MRLPPLIVVLTAALAVAVPRLAGQQPRSGPPGAPEDLVRVDGATFRDAGGPFNALGASLFWLAWGFEHDRRRLESNLRTLADAGVDFVRALAVVGPGHGWEDRTIDPRAPTWREAVAGATDLAYDRYGLRVQWTIFGGVDGTPTAAERRRVVDEVIAVVAERPHKIFAVEIANEAFQNGFNGESGVAELRELGKIAASRLDVPVALSSAPGDDACPTYAGAGVDFATIHYDRDVSQARPWAPVLRPWTYPSAFDAACRGALPRAVSNNEPIGPQSSVAAEGDALRLVLAYVTTFVAGNGAYVLHTGPGIRGGGADDRARGRSANIGEFPNAARILGALGAARKALPPGLAGWAHHDASSASAPFGGFQPAIERGTLAGAFSATRGVESVTVVLGLTGQVRLTSRSASVVDVIDPLTWKTIGTHRLAAGESFNVRARRDGDGLIVKGGPRP